MASLFRAAFPSATLTDQDGNLTPAWRGFFQSLYARTGSANGVSSDTSALEAELEAERQARIAADAALSIGLAAERTARQQADSDEVTARKTADNALSAQIKRAGDEYVPKAQLCGMWAGCDLGFLPTADPGSGKPWNDSGHLAIGTAPTATNGIELEDASGRFALEDGSGIWLWGSVPQAVGLEDVSGRWVLEDGTGAWMWE